MITTLVVRLAPAVERGAPYRVTPDSWPGTPQYRSEWRASGAPQYVHRIYPPSEAALEIMARVEKRPVRRID